MAPENKLCRLQSGQSGKKGTIYGNYSMKINYEPLSEWLFLNKLNWGDLAEAGGISRGRLSTLKAAGKPVPVSVMLNWMEQFGWTYEEMNRFCMNAPAKTDKPLTKPTLAQVAQLVAAWAEANYDS